MDSYREIEEKINSGVYQLVQKRNRKSAIWSIFAEILKDDETILEGFVCCRNCKHILRYNGQQSSNLNRHKCFNLTTTSGSIKRVTEEDKQEAIDACTTWLIEDCLPFTAIDGTGFLEMVNLFLKIGARYGTNIDINDLLPDPSTLSSRITQTDQENENKEKSEIDNISFCTMNDTLMDADDLDLKNLLDEWNLIHHYDYFIEQRITLNMLTILKPKHIDKLFENLPIGDQALFEYQLQLWQQNRVFPFKSNNSATKKTKNPNKPNNAKKEAVIVPQMSVAPSMQLSSALRKSLDHSRQTSTSTPSVDTPTPISAVTPMTSSMPKQPGMAFLPVRYNLRSILEETRGGQIIMNYYAKHKILREEHRTALINVIARYIDANGGILSMSESSQLELQIVELFPTEKGEYYRTNRRGRIYNKVVNLKRVYKKFNMAPDEISPPSIENNSSTSGYSAPASPIEIKEEEDPDEYDDYKISEFRSMTQTCENYLHFWKNTQKIRLKQIEDIESLSQILEKWPEYKQQNAVEFINMDFKAKYPEANSFSEVFFQNKDKLEKLLHNKVAGYRYLQQYPNCSTESQNLILLWVMHQLFPPSQKVVVDEMGTKRKKRYSVQYSQNAFICIRNSMNSLEAALETQLSPGTPPMILIVGELAEIDQIFVYFEGVRFPMDSVVTAAQLVCELFFLFDLDYPEEAELFYCFLQSFFLNIESEVKNSKIYAVINEINAY
ncbi:uncharacterized protein LOC135959794 [Calliphora vicina]|uniref:uncharacterized protein LOC135959794 n=1 Tax=Calliphora vicina TaxID=7373 RepID=UPI00325BF0F8